MWKLQGKPAKTRQSTLKTPQWDLCRETHSGKGIVSCMESGSRKVDPEPEWPEQERWNGGLTGRKRILYKNYMKATLKR